MLVLDSPMVFACAALIGSLAALVWSFRRKP